MVSVRAEAARSNPSGLGRVLKTREPDAAFRELSAHLAAHALPASTQDPVRALASAELAVAEALDPRVQGADMARAVCRARAALALRPARQVDLFGFTALIDAKFPLKGCHVTALAELAEREHGREALLEAVDRGPGDGAIVWKRPGSPLELAASVVRHLVLGKGASLQLQLDAPLVRALETITRETGTAVQEAMGGAGAFAANLAAVLPEVDAHFFSSRPLATRIARRFAPGVSVLDAQGKTRPASEHGDPTRMARANLIAEYSPGDGFVVADSRIARVEGQEHPLVLENRGRVIFAGPSDERPGFGALEPEALRKIAEQHDFVFLVGAHYFTNGSPESCREEASRLAEQLEIMKVARPSLLRHWQYVVPKNPSNEALLAETLRGRFDSIALNAVELPDLLDRLAAAGLAERVSFGDRSRETIESLPVMLSAARVLADALDVERVHVHGFDGDVLVAPARHARDPERQVLALLRARQLAAMKAANRTGEIRDASEIWPIAPVVQGAGLARVQAFADALEAQLGLDPASRARAAERWWHLDSASKRLFVFVPARGFHDTTGGLVSLGDTIDASALVFGR